MTKEELVNELNYQMFQAEIQSENILEELQVYYSKLFLEKCNEVPEFKLDLKGRIELL